MEGKTRPRQRTPQVLRTFSPTRLQDDLLAAVYDRLLDASSRWTAFMEGHGNPSSHGSPPNTASWPTTGG